MHADVSDRIIVHGARRRSWPPRSDPGDPRDRRSTSYLVDWSDGHEALFFPTVDATIEPKEDTAPAAKA